MPTLTGSLPKLIEQGFQTDASLRPVLRPEDFSFPREQMDEALQAFRLLVDILAGSQALDEPRLILCRFQLQGALLGRAQGQVFLAFQSFLLSFVEVIGMVGPAITATIAMFFLPVTRNAATAMVIF